MTKLSIIIPCFNCASTLDDAVGSIFSQDCPIPFDVTMVDDCSTDATLGVMKSLAKRYKNIRLVQHIENKGGGAARNTAVGCSDGDLIFCLDSDDILGPGFLSKMVSFWLRQPVDGLGVNKSIKFNNRDISDIEYINEFKFKGERIPFVSLLSGSTCSLYSTFLITRSAFDKTGGYPTHHGFDTQGMAFRFLGNGFTAYTCPDTIYHHRVNFGPSYYLREAWSGRINHNWFLVLEEFLYVFNDEIKENIMDYGPFMDVLKNQYGSVFEMIRHSPNCFRSDLDSLIEKGRDTSIREMVDSKDRLDQYCVGTYYYFSRDIKNALKHYCNALELGFNYPVVYYRLLDCAKTVSRSDMELNEILLRLLPDRRNRPAIDKMMWKIKLRLTRLKMFRKLLRLRRNLKKRLNQVRGLD